MRPGAARATRDGGARVARSDLNRVATGTKSAFAATTARRSTRARDARRRDGRRARVESRDERAREGDGDGERDADGWIGDFERRAGAARDRRRRRREAMNFATYSESASEVTPVRVRRAR